MFSPVMTVLFLVLYCCCFSCLFVCFCICVKYAWTSLVLNVRRCKTGFSSELMYYLAFTKATIRLCSSAIILGRYYTDFFSKLLVLCRSSCPKGVLCFNNVKLHLEDNRSIDLNKKAAFCIGQVSCDRYYIFGKVWWFLCFLLIFLLVYVTV